VAIVALCAFQVRRLKMTGAPLFTEFRLGWRIKVLKTLNCVERLDISQCPENDEFGIYLLESIESHLQLLGFKGFTA
jgi:hypothetical protein